MKKYAIYTALVGKYDEVLQPQVVDERFDYILFSDSYSEKQIGVWQVRPIPYEDSNAMRKSRYVKCHPTKVLADYEASLYMDANIQVITPWVYERFIELVEAGVEWASIRHPDQHCIYEEICTIVSMRWVHDFDVVNWYGKLKGFGFPERYGLYENNVILRSHTAKVEQVGDLWWQTLERDCKRDQFSLMYVLWRVQPKMDYFLMDGECPRIGSENFAYYSHNPHKRVLELGFHEMMRYRIIRTRHPGNLRKGYHEMFDWVSRHKHPKGALLWWEVGTFLFVCPRLFLNAILNRFK